MKRLLFIVMALILVWGGSAYAQSGIEVNPHSVAFTASADHSGMAVDGVTPLVVKYEFRVYLESAPNGAIQGTPVDLGKPTPLTTGCPANVPAPCVVITDQQVPTLFSALAKNTKFVARVAAVSSLGEGASTPSNPFGFNGPPAAPGKPALSKQ